MSGIAHQPWNIWNSYIQPIQKITTDILFRLNRYLWYLRPRSDNGLTFSHLNWPTAQLHLPNQPQLLLTLTSSQNPCTTPTTSAIHIILHWRSISPHNYSKRSLTTPEITSPPSSTMSLVHRSPFGAPFSIHHNYYLHLHCAWTWTLLSASFLLLWLIIRGSHLLYQQHGPSQRCHPQNRPPTFSNFPNRQPPESHLKQPQSKAKRFLCILIALASSSSTHR